MYCSIIGYLCYRFVSLVVYNIVFLIYMLLLYSNCVSINKSIICSSIYLIIV